MIIEVLNTIKKKGDKWEFNGRFKYNQQWVTVISIVSDMKTESQIKKAIIKKIRAKAEQYKIEHDQPQEKKLSVDTVFKVVLP